MDLPDDLGPRIAAACRRLWERNLLAAADGNVSHRLPDGRIAVTASGVSKGFMGAADLAVLAPDGEVLAGRPSTERRMHLAIYAACPAARWVVHAHPPTAVAWTLARPDLTELPPDALPEVILAAGRIPIAPYARRGTSAMAEVLAPLLPDHRLIVLARHGALCWGETLEEAVGGIERLEHAAAMLKLAEELGGAKALPAEEIEALRAIRRGGDGRVL